MKRTIVLSLLMLFAVSMTAQETVTLRFTAKSSTDLYFPFDVVNVTNVTRGWTESLYYPDTTMVLTLYDNVGEMSEKPGFLSEAYPNPFHGETHIGLNIDEAGTIKVRILKTNGEIITEYASFVDSGVHRITVGMDKPQLALLVVSTASGQCVEKIINAGYGGDNRIEIQQISSVKSRGSKETKSVGEFALGDVMEYQAILYGFDGEPLLSSEVITQEQFGDETIALEFPVATPIIVPTQQIIDNEDAYAIEPITGGLHLNFAMTGVTHVELESVDAYALAGTFLDPNDIQPIITFNAPEGGMFESGRDYYIVTYPCDVYGGYRLSIFKDGQVAHYFGVHQVIEAGEYITPPDLDESELEFDDPDAPFVEDEPPGLNHATLVALQRYLNNPTEENKLLLMEQMGIRYDKVVARKKAKLRQLEREGVHQWLIDEMQAIVDEMVENREIRLEQQFRRLTDRREDDDPNDEWLVLRGVPTDNAYIAYAPVTNEDYSAFNPYFTYESGHERYPVVNITYFEAVAYCEWLGANDPIHAFRVTTEDDWIMAAGHMPKDVAMNSGNIHDGLTPVDYYAQTTGACGGIDFWGNSWEWTSTQNDEGLYIIKGGAWDSTRDQCRTEYSGDVRDGNTAYPNVGFRVVRIDR